MMVDRLEKEGSEVNFLESLRHDYLNNYKLNLSQSRKIASEDPIRDLDWLFISILLLGGGSVIVVSLIIITAALIASVGLSGALIVGGVMGLLFMSGRAISS